MNKEGKLLRPGEYSHQNINNYSIFDSDNVRGGRRFVETFNDLCNIPQDKVSENVTIVYVKSKNGDYRLVNKTLSQSSSGWEKIDYSKDLTFITYGYNPLNVNGDTLELLLSDTGGLQTKDGLLEIKLQPDLEEYPQLLSLDEKGLSLDINKVGTIVSETIEEKTKDIPLKQDKLTAKNGIYIYTLYGSTYITLQIPEDETHLSVDDDNCLYMDLSDKVDLENNKIKLEQLPSFINDALFIQYLQDVTPSGSSFKEDTLWYNPNAKTLKIWDGTFWVTATAYKKSVYITVTDKKFQLYSYDETEGLVLLLQGLTQTNCKGFIHVINETEDPSQQFDINLNDSEDILYIDSLNQLATKSITELKATDGESSIFTGDFIIDDTTGQLKIKTKTYQTAGDGLYITDGTTVLNIENEFSEKIVNVNRPQDYKIKSLALLKYNIGDNFSLSLDTDTIRALESVKRTELIIKNNRTTNIIVTLPKSLNGVRVYNMYTADEMVISPGLAGVLKLIVYKELVIVIGKLEYADLVTIIFERIDNCETVSYTWDSEKRDNLRTGDDFQFNIISVENRESKVEYTDGYNDVSEIKLLGVGHSQLDTTKTQYSFSPNERSKWQSNVQISISKIPKVLIVQAKTHPVWIVNASSNNETYGIVNSGNYSIGSRISTEDYVTLVANNLDPDQYYFYDWWDGKTDQSRVETFDGTNHVVNAVANFYKYCTARFHCTGCTVLLLQKPTKGDQTTETIDGVYVCSLFDPNEKDIFYFVKPSDYSDGTVIRNEYFVNNDTSTMYEPEGLPWFFRIFLSPKQEYIDIYVSCYIDKYTCTIEPTINGTVTCDDINKVGTTVNLTVTPDDGYEIDTIIVNGETITGTSFTMPEEDVTITATFKKISYTITVTQSTGGTISSNKTTATAGDIVTLTATASSGYTFSSWVVKTTSGSTVTVSNNSFTMPASDVMVSATFVEKTLTGQFSVSATKKVTFSKGNLQYTRSTDTWSFAENQYDMIGVNNLTGGQLSWDDTYGYFYKGDFYDMSSLADKIDLFYQSFKNYSYQGGQINNYGVGQAYKNINASGDFVDWGTNTISTNAPNTYRTLTKDEWAYLLNTRTDAINKKGVACIKLNDDGSQYANGLILLPDDWVCPEGVTFKSGFSKLKSIQAYADHQTFTLNEWLKLEAAGAVFLISAGIYNSSFIIRVQEMCVYWSSDIYLSNSDSSPWGGYALEYNPVYSTAQMIDSCLFSYKAPVRLVKDT